jgi:hypothetical protein
MPPPAKRRKVDPNDTQSDSQEIEKLEGDLKHAIENSSSLNALADLLKEATKNKKQPQLLHKSIYALYRIFSLLISANWYHSSSRPNQKNLVIRKWLVERLDQYLELLSSLLDHTEPTISVCRVYLLAEGCSTITFWIASSESDSVLLAEAAFYISLCDLWPPTNSYQDTAPDCHIIFDFASLSYSIGRSNQ